MKKHALLMCAAVLMCGSMLAGCSSSDGTTAKEITSTAPEIEQLAESSYLDGWDSVKDTYASYDSEADDAAAQITSANVKETVLADIDTIVDNIPAIVEASETDEITADTEAAAKAIYVAAKTLEHLGNNDAYDVSLYIADIALDAQNLVHNLYEGLDGNVDARQSECDVNRDRILSFTDEEWSEYAATL